MPEGSTTFCNLPQLSPLFYQVPQLSRECSGMFYDFPSHSIKFHDVPWDGSGPFWGVPGGSIAFQDVPSLSTEFYDVPGGFPSPSIKFHVFHWLPWLPSYLFEVVLGSPGLEGLW